MRAPRRAGRIGRASVPARVLALVLALGGSQACTVSPEEDPSFGSGQTSFGTDGGDAETGFDDTGESGPGGETGAPTSTGGPTGTGAPDTGDSGGEDCGNGALDPGESCDGQDFDGETCESYGFDGGSLTCSGCSIDTSGCFGCGNGTLEDGEECDGSDFGAETCATVGDFYDGTLVCNDDCTLDTSGCLVAECGDGVKNQDSEECDGDDLDGNACADVGNYWMGDLACDDSCAFDVSDCELAECGDGVKNQDAEECDGNDLDNKSCVDIGFDWGDVTCQQDCSFDDSECLICGANLDDCETDDDCCPGLSCSGWPLFWCS